VVRILALADPPLLPSAATTASAPWTTLFSPLTTWPAHTPVNASRATSRRSRMTRGRCGTLRPSPQWTLTLNLLPVSRRTAAPWLAYVLPYRRFDTALAVCVARLGVDAVCYSFIVADFHPLLLAGFAGAPEIPLSPRRRLQHFQRPTSSHVSSITPRATHRGDEYV